jgi:hypothetical protein
MKVLGILDIESGHNIERALQQSTINEWKRLKKLQKTDPQVREPGGGIRRRTQMKKRKREMITSQDCTNTIALRVFNLNAFFLVFSGLRYIFLRTYSTCYEILLKC